MPSPIPILRWLQHKSGLSPKASGHYCGHQTLNVRSVNLPLDEVLAL